MRILLVSQMWPGPEDPDLGAFVAAIARELEGLGHEVDRAVIDARGGGPQKYAGLLRRAVGAAGRRPDVVFSHMLVPAGLAGVAAAARARVPHVVMAHGQDVANLGQVRGITAATRRVVRRSAAVIANSAWLGEELARHVPDAAARTTVIDCGVDLLAFGPRDPDAARAEVHWGGRGPRLLCVGSLIERKNVVRLADAFGRLGEGSLVFVGDGPLRGELEGRPGVRVTGKLPHAAVPAWIGACDVLCQPSLVEPFGQAALEAMAMERSVVATRVGGPPEFVTPGAGVLVDPTSTDALEAGLREALALPRPNQTARAAAREHDVRRQAGRMADVLAGAVAAAAAR